MPSHQGKALICRPLPALMPPEWRYLRSVSAPGFGKPHFLKFAAIMAKGFETVPINPTPQYRGTRTRNFVSCEAAPMARRRAAYPGRPAPLTDPSRRIPAVRNKNSIRKLGRDNTALEARKGGPLLGPAHATPILLRSEGEVSGTQDGTWLLFWSPSRTASISAPRRKR